MKVIRHRRLLAAAWWGALLGAVLAPSASPSTGDAHQARLSADLEEGRPVVVHVVVALCDNDNQGIVPVSRQLGDGQARVLPQASRP
jgi:hypothetical protein